MEFTVPTCWKELTPEQLRYVLRLLWLYNGHEDGQQLLQVAAFAHFCGFEVVRRTDKGWLCRQRESGKVWILDPYLLPSMLQSVEWLKDTDKMDVRIGQVGDCKAVDFELQELPFGKYLEAENNFQSYLQSKQEKCLRELAKILYLVPDGNEGPAFAEKELLGAFLWFNAAKQLLGRVFHNFLKPADGKPEAVTQESLFEATRAQIRLLTKGDVTKQKYILEETDTWTALAELDALAKEAEEIRRKYGK